jgi:hypothetical protein
VSAARLRVRRGAVHIDRDTYERLFAPLTGLVLLREGSTLLVLPVRLAGAGGYLVKVRNAAGDRVVDAADFWRENGIDDGAELELEGTWDDARGALVVADAFRPMQT